MHTKQSNVDIKCHAKDKRYTWALLSIGITLLVLGGLEFYYCLVTNQLNNGLIVFYLLSQLGMGVLCSSIAGILLVKKFRASTNPKLENSSSHSMPKEPISS